MTYSIVSIEEEGCCRSVLPGWDQWAVGCRGWRTGARARGCDLAPQTRATIAKPQTAMRRNCVTAVNELKNAYSRHANDAFSNL